MRDICSGSIANLFCVRFSFNGVSHNDHAICCNLKNAWGIAQMCLCENRYKGWGVTQFWGSADLLGHRSDKFVPKFYKLGPKSLPKLMPKFTPKNWVLFVLLYEKFPAILPPPPPGQNFIPPYFELA